MKSIGLCFGLLIAAVAIVVWVNPGSKGASSSEHGLVTTATESVAAPVKTVETKTAAVEANTVETAAVETAAVQDTGLKSTGQSNTGPTETKLVNAASNDDPLEPSPAPANRRAEPQVDPRTKGVVIKKSSAAARAKGEITFDDLKFNIEKDAKFSEDQLDDDVKSLDGLNVQLSGFILPTTLYSETNIQQFILVRDNQECCFGPGAALFDCVVVEMQDDHSTDFVTRPVTVYGKLKIDTEKYKYPGGKGPRGEASHFAIFRLEGQKVN